MPNLHFTKGPNGENITQLLPEPPPKHGSSDGSVLDSRWKGPNQEPALELHSRAAPSLEAHHHVNGPDIVRNSRVRRIKKFK